MIKFSIQNPINKALLTALKFLLPFLLWIYLLKAYIWGEAIIKGDTFHIYSAVKFYMDNFRHSVFPLWNPFNMTGMTAQILMNYIGAYNPIWMLTLILNVSGVHAYKAFIITMICYCYIGSIGFYLLARAVLRHHVAAYTAFLLLLFSANNLFILVDFNIPLIFIPGVWFFFFLVRFCQNGGLRYFMGICFSLMLIVSTYLPTYALTVFLFAVLIFVILNVKATKLILGRVFLFLKTHPPWVLLFLFGIGVALFPGANAYHLTSQRDVLVSSRHTTQTLFNKGARIDDYSRSTDGDLSARMSLDDLFSNLGRLHYGRDILFYVSIFAYILLALSSFNTTNRRIVFLVLLGLLLFLLMITNASSLHRFLFNHLFYFRFTRNIFFFLSYFMAIFCLLVGEQTRIFLEQREALRKNKYSLLLAIVVFHVCFWIFISSLEDVIFSSFLTVLLSLVFWCAFLFLKGRHNHSILFLLLFCCIVVQPIEVFLNHNRDHVYPVFFQKAAKYPSTKATFSYVRDKNTSIIKRPEGNYPLNAWYRISLTDAPQFDSTGFPCYWTRHLYTRLKPEIFDSYARDKFLLYDRIELLQDHDVSAAKLEEVFTDRANRAIVFPEDRTKMAEDLANFLKTPNQDQGQAVILDGPSQHHLRVNHFDSNSLGIETTLTEAKFLVYNDSFLRHWQATLDGTRIPLYRANIAFKGVAIPPGRHLLTFRYHPPGGMMGYFFVLSVFQAFFGLVIVLFIDNRKKGFPAHE